MSLWIGGKQQAVSHFSSIQSCASSNDSHSTIMNGEEPGSSAMTTAAVTTSTSTTVAATAAAMTTSAIASTTTAPAEPIPRRRSRRNQNREPEAISNDSVPKAIRNHNAKPLPKALRKPVRGTILRIVDINSMGMPLYRRGTLNANGLFKQHPPSRSNDNNIAKQAATKTNDNHNSDTMIIDSPFYDSVTVRANQPTARSMHHPGRNNDDNITQQAPINDNHNSVTTIIGSPLYRGSPLCRSATVRTNRSSARNNITKQAPTKTNDSHNSDTKIAKAAGPLKKRFKVGKRTVARRPGSENVPLRK